MKTVFDKATRDELIARIEKVEAHKPAQWGKMNAYQMLRHCRQWEEWVHSNQQNKQVFIGRIFGKMAMKSVLKDDTPLRHNTPTLPGLLIKEQAGDMITEKLKWIALIDQYPSYPGTGFMHTFFGKMTRVQVGIMAYKHTDHHLRQFGY